MHQMISIFYILFSGCTNDDGSAGDGSEQGTCESGELSDLVNLGESG